MTDAEILENAADLIEQYGLARGDLFDSRKRLCTWGALHVASHGEVMVADRVAGYLIPLLPESAGGRISSWNDKARKSAVVAKLRKAAKLAREAVTS